MSREIRKAFQYGSFVLVLAGAGHGLFAQQAQPSSRPPAAENISAEDVIGAIEFRGSHRVPQDTLRTLVTSRKGDRFDASAIERDTATLMNTGRYDDVRVECAAGPDGWVVRFIVTERKITPTVAAVDIHEILQKYQQSHPR